MNFVKLCLEMGATRAVEIPVDKLVFQPKLRELCEQNACGRFASNYTCPPLVGEVEDLIEQLKGFSTAVIWQNVYTLEDSFDFDGMIDAQAKHNAMTQEIAHKAYDALGRVMRSCLPQEDAHCVINALYRQANLADIQVMCCRHWRRMVCMYLKPP